MYVREYLPLMFALQFSPLNFCALQMLHFLLTGETRALLDY